MAIQLVNDIKPTGVTSSYVNAPFDEAKTFLENLGYRIITAQENAGLRIQFGKNAEVSIKGNYVKEGSLYIPKKGRFITRGSLVMASPKDATEAHRKGSEFYVEPEQAELVLADSVAVSHDIRPIPTNRFGEDAITVFVFGDIARKYGEFLKEANINEMPLSFDDQDHVDGKSKPYANQLWLRRLDCRSGLLGNHWDLSYLDAVRGVLVGEARSAEATLKKIEETYTLSDILKVLGVANKSLESLVTLGLRANRRD